MRARLSPFLPHIIGVLLIGTVAIGSYYSVANASSSSPKVIWTTNPVTISFNSVSVGSSGSVGDSFKCAPPVTNVVLATSVSSSNIKLTVNPKTGPCGPSYGSITITAQCQTLTAAKCKGTYTGTVIVHNGSQYGNTIPPSLTVNIVVH